MSAFAIAADERVAGVAFTRDSLRVDMKDGRTITVPLAWYPRLLQASSKQRKKWQISGGGYGIHWPEVDEDLSTEGLLRGAPSVRSPDTGRKGGSATRRGLPERVAPARKTVDHLLRKAISKKKLIRFSYHGKSRIAEPHDYGIQNGSIRLLCYQIGGESSTGSVPAWRWIEVSEMKALEILEKGFPGNQPSPSGQHHRWDRVFARVGEAEP